MINLLIGLLIIAMLLYIVNAYAPFGETAKKVVNAIGVVAAVLWVLMGFNIIPSISVSVSELEAPSRPATRPG